MHTDEVSNLIRDVADRVILPRWRALDAADIHQKRPGDLVTIADREAERELADALRAAHPGVLIVGEEAAFHDPTLVAALAGADHAFVIDPVDGTRNFAGGSPHFGVMLAELRAGRTVRAWIWQPAHQTMFVAEQGSGAWHDGVRITMAPRPAPYRVAIYGSLRRPEIPQVVRTTHRLGACAIDYARVLTGGLDAVAYKSLHPWDHLPGALLLTEAGGFVGIRGRAYGPGVGGGVLFAAASRPIYDLADATFQPA